METLPTQAWPVGLQCQRRPGADYKCRISGPPDRLSQNLHLNKTPTGDSCTHARFGSTGVNGRESQVGPGWRGHPKGLWGLGRALRRKAGSTDETALTPALPRPHRPQARQAWVPGLRTQSVPLATPHAWAHPQDEADSGRGTSHLHPGHVDAGPHLELGTHLDDPGHTVEQHVVELRETQQERVRRWHRKTPSRASLRGPAPLLSRPSRLTLGQLPGRHRL